MSGKNMIITIEGLSENGLHKLQKAWLEIGVSQCGYCQPGQIITALELLNENPNPSESEINDKMFIFTLCSTYNKIVRHQIVGGVEMVPGAEEEISRLRVSSVLLLQVSAACDLFQL
ncbi:hypothetical protein MASR1M45_29490 [Candidatus Kapaibacterium sp.]